MTSAAAFTRQVRAELRLYRSRGVVLLAVAVAFLASACLLAGEAYGRDQIAAARDAPVFSCAHLARYGVAATECAETRRQQAESRTELRRIAARIGPGAASARTDVGAAALALGISMTAVGLVAFSAAMALVLGGEAESGVAAGRDRMMGTAAPLVRVLGAVAAWSAISLVVIAAAVIVNRWAGIDVAARRPDHRADLSFLVQRLAAALVAVAVLSSWLIAWRAHLTTRLRWFAAASSGVVFSVIVERSIWSPIGGAWGAAGFAGGQWLSYIDAMPVWVRGAPTAWAVWVSLLSVVVAVTVTGARRRNVPPPAVRSPTRRP